MVLVFLGGEMKIFLLIFFLGLPAVVRADDYGVNDADMQKQMQIASLRREIDELETQLNECKRKNKNWKTATYVGAAGTAITGVVAIAQGIKLNNIKKEKQNENK